MAGFPREDIVHDEEKERVEVRKNLACLAALWLLTAGGVAPHLAAQQPASKPDRFPSDELNKNLPKWLRFSGEYRARTEGFTGGGYKAGSDDAYLLSRLRINMKIQPAAWLKLVVQGQDARVFWKNQHPPVPPFQNVMDLRLGYVEVGDTENKPAGVRMGRQELAFGDERLVGNTNWLNTARSFDAVRATFRYRGYRLDAFASSVVNQRNGKFDQSSPGNNFYGLYGGLEKLVPKAVVEPYFFWRRAPNQRTETGTLGVLNFATVGVRWVGKLPRNLDYGTEMARQAGALGADSINAWAGHWLLGYTLAQVSSRPRIVAEYNYASGDRNPRDGRRETFDQLYPTAHDKYGLADQVGWKNIHHLRGGLELKPGTKWLLMGKYNSWWLASPRDALYNARGLIVARVTDGSAGRFVGQGVDFQTVYSLSKHFQIAGGYSYLLPGTFLKKATPGNPFTFPYLSFNYFF